MVGSFALKGEELFLVEGVVKQQGRQHDCQGSGDFFEPVDAVKCWRKLVSQRSNAMAGNEDEQGESEVQGVVL